MEASEIIIQISLGVMGLCVIAIIYCIIGLLWCNYQIRRNIRIYKVRYKILNENMTLYEKLPSYDEMLNSWKPATYKYWINQVNP